MRVLRAAVGAVMTAAAFVGGTLPLGVIDAAHAAGCDTSPADAVEAGWSPTQIAASGSLAAGTSATVTVTALNATGQCVAGASVGLYLSAPAGGKATTSTGSCPYGALGPNFETCTADANGTVTVWYTTPAALPNGGTDTIQAKVGSQAPPGVSYTYGTLTVTSVGVSATEGASFRGTVATLTEQNFASPPALSVTVDWGDGSASGATTTTSPTVALSVTASHTFAEESPSGGQAFKVTVNGSTTATVTAAGTATVADAALTASGVNVSGRRKTSFTSPVATFTDADPGGTVADYTATISWGDGTSSIGSIAASTAGFTVTGTHAYAGTGSYTATTTITDSGGASSQTTSTMSITNGGGKSH